MPIEKKNSNIVIPILLLSSFKKTNGVYCSDVTKLSDQRSLQRFPDQHINYKTDNGRIKCPEKEFDAPKTLVTGTNRF